MGNKRALNRARAPQHLAEKNSRTNDCSKHPCSRDEGGFALLAVAITLAALSLMMAVVVQGARESMQNADARVSAVRTAAAIDAALATAARDLSQTGAMAQPLLSQPQTIVTNGVAVTLSVRPEAAKIDLNAADPALISALFRVHGLSSSAALRYASEIADWRDTDAVTQNSGAEAAEYLASGRSYVPSNSGFESVSELALILHGSKDLAACVAPDVTVFSGQAGVDIASASANVREAAKLAGIAPAATSVVAQASLSSGHVIEAGAIFEINAVAKDEVAGTTSSRRTILRVTGSLTNPIWVLARYMPIPRKDEAEAACERLDHLSRGT